MTKVVDFGARSRPSSAYNSGPNRGRSFVFALDDSPIPAASYRTRLVMPSRGRGAREGLRVTKVVYFGARSRPSSAYGEDKTP